MTWKSIESAPMDGTYVIVAGSSGYIGTPLRVDVCKYDAEYRPYSPWVNYASNTFTEGGSPPKYWMPLPEPPKGE